MDFKPLVEKLKTKGIDHAEDVVATLVSEVFDFLTEEGLKSDNALLKGVAVILPVVKPVVLAEVDKMDGEDDPGR